MPFKITSVFNLHTAYSLAKAAELVYQSEHKIKDTLLQRDFNACEFFDEQGTQCFIADHPDYTLISFRGTELALEDWNTDLHCRLQNCLMGQVHSGFDRAINKIWPDIKRHIYRIREKPIFITGHSLGAALAGLCAARLKLSAIDVTAVYTFGQPRLGDERFAVNYNQLLKNKTFRLVNNNDIVTRIPPRALGYSHVGTLQYFTEPGQLTDNITRWQLFLDRLNGRIEDLLEWGSDGLKDHSITEYVRLCEHQLLLEID